MIRNVLTHIGGVEAYGIVSIILFLLFFLGVLLWAFRLRRSHLDAMGRLPLEDDDGHAGAQPDFNHTDAHE